MMKLSMFVVNILILAVLIQKALALCPYACTCGKEPTKCGAGISPTVDGCNCCKVCPKQLGESCNGQDKICDPMKRLYCDFTDLDSEMGTCKARSGQPCWYHNVRIASGRVFSPSCREQCTCVDGAMGCVPLCPHETQMPSLSRCKNPRLERNPDECCGKWVCDTEPVAPASPFFNLLWGDNSGTDTGYPADFDTHLLFNQIEQDSDFDDESVDMNDEVDDWMDYQMRRSPSSNRAPVDEDFEYWQDNALPGDSEIQNNGGAIHYSECIPQTSTWTECSKTCGVGISTRVSNVNRRCNLKREVRLCEIRPCSSQTPKISNKKNKHCVRQRKARRRVTMEYAGCVSERRIKPRYCGTCTGDNRCCTPRITRTESMRFVCQGHHIINKAVMVIRSCACHSTCTANRVRSTKTSWSSFLASVKVLSRSQ